MRQGGDRARLARGDGAGARGLVTTGALRQRRRSGCCPLAPSCGCNSSRRATRLTTHIGSRAARVVCAAVVVSLRPRRAWAKARRSQSVGPPARTPCPTGREASTRRSGRGAGSSTAAAPSPRSPGNLPPHPLDPAAAAHEHPRLVPDKSVRARRLPAPGSRGVSRWHVTERSSSREPARYVRLCRSRAAPRAPCRRAALPPPRAPEPRAQTAAPPDP